MATRIPDLWQVGVEAPRLYDLYLAHLLGHQRYERMIEVCRQIRQYAARAADKREGFFTYHMEIEALCRLGEYQAAWLQLRRFEKAVHGEQWNLVRREWIRSDFYALEIYYAPLLYYRGHFRLGCTLLETALDCWFERKTLCSYNILHQVYNGDEEPYHRVRVTLSHFYKRLGRDLREWRHWEKFVKNLHSRLLKATAVRRKQLIKDPNQLPAFFDRLMELQEERTSSGVTCGQSDLIDSPEKVQQRQEKTRRELEEFQIRRDAGRAQRNDELLALFPDLAELLS